MIVVKLKIMLKSQLSIQLLYNPLEYIIYSRNSHNGNHGDTNCPRVIRHTMFHTYTSHYYISNEIIIMTHIILYDDMT